MPNPERQQEQDQIKNSLGEVLGEFEGLDDELKSKIVEKIAGLGLKDKAAVDRVSRQSRAKGLEAGEASVKEEVDSLKSQLSEFAEMLKGKTEKDPEGDPNPESKDVDPVILDLQKNQKDLLKQFSAISAKLNEKDAQVDALRKENTQKEIRSRLTGLLTESGFEEASALLTLIDAKADFKLDPEAEDGDGILVFQKGSEKYFGGEELPVTGREFLDKFKSTDLAKRFLSVPGSATGATGFLGGDDAHDPGSPFSPDKMAKAFKSVGINV